MLRKKKKNKAHKRRMNIPARNRNIALELKKRRKSKAILTAEKPAHKMIKKEECTYKNG
jgi:hypothetical protein